MQSHRVSKLWPSVLSSNRFDNRQTISFSSNLFCLYTDPVKIDIETWYFVSDASLFIYTEYDLLVVNLYVFAVVAFENKLSSFTEAT